MRHDISDIGQEAARTIPPALFNIELTNRCPMRCVMCPRTAHMTRTLGDMEFGLFEKIIDELVAVNPRFTGDRVLWLHHFGESLTHPEFDRFITYAASRQVRTGLSVNPFMLDPGRSERLLKASPHILYLSLDGHDDESFYRIRGMTGAFELSRSRLLEFLRLKKELGCAATTILSMIDFGLNDASVVAQRAFWQSLEGIDSFLVKEFTTWDGACEDISSLAPGGRSPGQGRNEITCDLPFDSMTILWNGDAVPCCFDYNGKYLLGNARRQSLTEIWNGDAMAALRREFSSGRVVNSLCRKCENLRQPRN
jgi:radical SAM protein with 4Fe4S-binding SPASM domain